MNKHLYVYAFTTRNGGMVLRAVADSNERAARKRARKAVAEFTGMEESEWLLHRHDRVDTVDGLDVILLPGGMVKQCRTTDCA